MMCFINIALLSFCHFIQISSYIMCYICAHLSLREA